MLLMIIDSMLIKLSNNHNYLSVLLSYFAVIIHSILAALIVNNIVVANQLPLLNNESMVMKDTKA